jgi:hypothetical protein
MTNILAAQSTEMRTKAETLLQQADRLLCESWNERMWSDGEPIDPSPTIDQAINGGFPWLEIQCSRCKTPSDVDLASMKHPPTTFVHDLASRVRCRKCARVGRRWGVNRVDITPAAQRLTRAQADLAHRKEGAARERRPRVSDDPLPLLILELRAQISELSASIRQLQLSGLDAAAPRLLISRKRAELEDLTRQTNQRPQGGRRFGP